MHGSRIKRLRNRFSDTLSRFDLDDSAIEAEAIEKSSADLELLDRMRRPDSAAHRPTAAEAPSQRDTADGLAFKSARGRNSAWMPRKNRQFGTQERHSGPSRLLKKLGR
jgi:hypothetical protein